MAGLLAHFEVLPKAPVVVPKRKAGRPPKKAKEAVIKLYSAKPIRLDQIVFVSPDELVINQE
jgi:hypothetical protein